MVIDIFLTAPAFGWRAVFGKAPKREVHDVAFFAVAQVSSPTDGITLEKRIVGIVHRFGDFQSCEGDQDFAGYVEPGQDVERTTPVKPQFGRLLGVLVNT